jgi:hypothetical protein
MRPAVGSVLSVGKNIVLHLAAGFQWELKPSCTPQRGFKNK